MIRTRQVKPEPGRHADYAILAKDSDTELSVQYVVVYAHICPRGDASLRARAVLVDLRQRGEQGNWRVFRHSLGESQPERV